MFLCLLNFWTKRTRAGGVFFEYILYRKAFQEYFDEQKKIDAEKAKTSAEILKSLKEHK